MGAPVMRSALAHARYRWNHGTGGWAAARAMADNVPGRGRLAAEVARTDGSLVVGYDGYASGRLYVVPFLAEQLERTGGPVTVTEHRRPEDARQDADIMLVGCSRRRAEQLSGTASVTLPYRVQQLLPVTPDPAAMHARVSRSERRQFAAQRRKHDWTLETSTSDADLKFFYERMHLPTMGVRHGDATRSSDWDTSLHCLLRRGMLHFIVEGDRRVGGVLCRLDDGGRTLRMRMLGVLDGDDEHYRSGAVKAIWYLTVEWAASNGIQLIDMSTVEPFPGKGVFQFKRRLHPTATVPTDHFGDKRIHLRVMRDTDAVRDFLVATPMVGVDEAGTLSAVHFFDHRRPANTRIVGTGPGIELTTQIDLDDFLHTPRPVASAPDRLAEAA